MEANIIRNKKAHKHNIEAYRFKVLSTSVVGEEDVEKEEPKPLSKPISESEPIDADTQMQEPSEPQEQLMQEPNQAQPSDSFVEKLLKKTDELSSNIIKLQMQIESQEEEFEKRLNEERERAKEDAYKEGYEKANEDNQEKLKDTQAQYSRSIKLLEDESKKFEEFTQKTSDELTSVAIDVAKEVIGKEVDEHSASIASTLAKELLNELDSTNSINIKVNPKDYEALKDEFSSNAKIAITSDEAISQGGVIISSDVGNIDGSLEVRLGKIKQMMDE